jgi:acyl carrier protein
VSQVLDVVANKTGYPKDMLDLDLDLEADLGIDTVKQAETFAAIRETFAIPVQEGLNLREYPTLASVVGFVRKNRPDLARGGAVTGEGQGASHSQSCAQLRLPRISNLAISSSADRAIVDKVLQVVADKTGYPKDMLELDLDLEADLGIDTVKQAETFATVRETFATFPDPGRAEPARLPDAGQRDRLRAPDDRPDLAAASSAAPSRRQSPFQLRQPPSHRQQ